MNTATASTKSNNNTARAAEVDRAVMAYFIKHGRACTAKELAEHMERGEQWVRKVMSDNHGCTRGSIICEESRESYSKSYPSMQMGYHKVTCYQPTMESMRQTIIAQAADIRALTKV
ncbi:MAG: hypothetical protein NTZ64_02870 [Polaromonas sp.]|nr:hypothetical protein [Polaromonas sp.]